MRFILVILIVVVGCAGEKKTNSSYVETIYQEDLAISSYTDRLKLDSNAPNGLGVMISAIAIDEHRYGIGSCTWFQVGEKHMMTNSHCIPEELKNNKNLDCSNLITGKITTSQGAVKLSCKKLIYASTISAETRASRTDLALIQVNELIPNTAFELSRVGVAKNSKYIIESMSPLDTTSNALVSTYKKHECIAATSEIYSYSADNEESLVATLFSYLDKKNNCNIIQGNSGSPVLFGGKVVAITYATAYKAKPGDTNYAEQQDDSKLKLDRSQFSDHVALVSNLRCAKGISQFSEVSPLACLKSAEKTKQDLEALKTQRTDQFRKKLLKYEKDYLASLPQYIEFESQSRSQPDGSTFISAVPRCIKRQALWTKESKEKFESSNINVHEMIPSLTIENQIMLDKYGKYQIKSTAIRSDKVLFGNINMLSFREPKRVLKEKSSDVDYSVQLGQARRSYDLILSICQ